MILDQLYLCPEDHFFLEPNVFSLKLSQPLSFCSYLSPRLLFIIYLAQIILGRGFWLSGGCRILSPDEGMGECVECPDVNFALYFFCKLGLI